MAAALTPRDGARSSICSNAGAIDRTVAMNAIATEVDPKGWFDGRSLLWLGRRKRPGRGEGSSGLRFDVISRG